MFNIGTLVSKQFRIRLSETIIWCNSRPRPWDPRTTFCSLDLAYCDLLATNRQSMVRTVVHRRSEILTPPHLKNPIRPATSLGGGRLLGYCPDINLFHGLEKAECEGFVNQCSVPGWDTWVDYLDTPVDGGWNSFLVSWVPVDLINMVDSAVAVCPEASIRWIDAIDCKFSKDLESFGLAPGNRIIRASQRAIVQ